MKTLLKSGLIEPREVGKIANVIYSPTFARICTYVVTTNYHRGHKDIDPRDAYAQCARDIVETLDKLVKTSQSLE